jgi:hypothetical protein
MTLCKCKITLIIPVSSIPRPEKLTDKSEVKLIPLHILVYQQ